MLLSLTRDKQYHRIVRKATSQFPASVIERTTNRRLHIFENASLNFEDLRKYAIRKLRERI